MMFLSNFTMNFGAGTFDWVATIAQNVYDAVKTPVSALVIVAVVVCLAGMMFSKNQKAVEEYKGWMKRIIICYVAFLLVCKIISGIKELLPAKQGSWSDLISTDS